MNSQSPRGLPVRRQRSKSQVGRPRRSTNLKLGTKVCRVFAKVIGTLVEQPYGSLAKWEGDYLKEGGNGSTRQSLIVTSTSREFECDGIILGENERTTQQMVADPVVEEFFDGRSQCVLAYGAAGTGKTTLLFNGEDDDLGLIYCLFKSINQRRAVQSANTTLSVSMFELDERYNIRDLFNNDRRIKAPRVTNKTDTVSDELLIDGLIEKVVNTNQEAGNLVSQGLQKLKEEGDSHVVVRINLAQYIGTTRKLTTLDIVDCFHQENELIKDCLERLRSQDYEQAFSGSAITRFSMPKLLRGALTQHPPPVTFLCTMSTMSLNDSMATLQTLKVAKEAWDLRKQNSGGGASPRSHGGSPACSPAPCPVSPGVRPSAFDGSTAFSPLRSPGRGSATDLQQLEEMDPLEADRERRLRHEIGRLAASQAQVHKLENELHQRNLEIQDEKNQRVAAQQETQDMKLRVQVLEEKVNFEAEKLDELREDLRARDAQLKASKMEQFQIAQDLLAMRACAKKAEGEKEMAEYELDGIKEKLKSFVATGSRLRTTHDMMMEIRLMLDLYVSTFFPNTHNSRTGHATHTQITPQAQPRAGSLQEADNKPWSHEEGVGYTLCADPAGESPQQRGTYANTQTYCLYRRKLPATPR